MNKFIKNIDITTKSLFAKLEKLFSSDVIVRNIGGTKLKIADTDRIMTALDRSSLRDRFNRIHSTSYNTTNRDFSLSYLAARIDLFRDYDTMDLDPIISSALDIYADECLTLNEYGKMLTVHSDNVVIKEILYNLFYDILNIEGNLWSWVRNMCKYGDFFLKLYITPKTGIYMTEPISAYNMERIEEVDRTNRRKVYFRIRKTDVIQEEILNKYQVAHFRLLTDSNFLPYGKSMIEGARRVWKQLSLIEDAMLIHRIMRAPEKRVFKLGIGSLPESEVELLIKKQRDEIKKEPYIDPATGEYNLRFNLHNMVEDYIIPVRPGDSETGIETLPGMEWTGIDDIEYIRNKMMAALKIPKAFLGYEEGISGKATLASEDVRFARTIQRLQRVIISELSKIAIIHLYSQGFTDENLVNFELELTNPSTIFEQEKIEVLSDKVSLASDIIENNLFSKEWIYKNIFKLSDENISEIEDQIVKDKKYLYRISSIEEEGQDPVKSIQNVSTSSTVTPGEKSGEEETPITEKKERDQSGKKDASEYPFGEDPLGKLSRKESPGTDRKIKNKARDPFLESKAYFAKDILSNENNHPLVLVSENFNSDEFNLKNL